MKMLRILHVEDNRGDARMVREALDLQGLDYHLDLASDGEQALRFIEGVGKENLPPDVLLLDLNLPKADGYEVLRAFRLCSKCDGTLAIIVTSSDAPTDRQQALHLGADRYFVKPVDVDEYMHLGTMVMEIVGMR
jgi:CheY-like chemotaxis protein